MTNQSKWLISAYAIFFCGGVLVPLDYKLTADEQLQLLAHSKAEVLVVEYHLWRAITQAEHSRISPRASCSSPKRRRMPISPARSAGKNFAAQREPAFRAARAQRSGLHRLFLRHRWPAEGLRAHARKLSRAVHRADGAVSVLAGRALPQHSADESRDRFHGRIHRAVHLRRARSCICARCGRNSFAKPSRATRSPT